jgi:hypothetical protein
MKKCAQCHGKFRIRSALSSVYGTATGGLPSLLFCSVHLYEMERSEANAKHRWYNFVASGSRQS